MCSSCADTLHFLSWFVELLRKRRLLSAFFVNAHVLRGADINYLALQLLLAPRSYRQLMSRIQLRLSKFQAGFPVQGSRALNVQPLR